ncbi:MAG TPA: hypothetical protein VI953_01820 [Candidatus Paceibacterota bacterium]|uniref:Uncharacterized protein n=1 Tax=Candidatus Wildermuthbacteria bacterium RIFCSPHIGHO2_01_FULL_49_22b TaxID=1802448 RepID=A0A1G2QX83_9BACT|nr:MAG: hypothetical protein A2672_00875 [Candidatus Wildermuthbacteria bacterium RIFCSPHIGHO2_01_FULL_49_22b]
MKQKNITALAFSAGVLTAAVLLIGQVVGASSTISTNISTDGTLSVTGIVNASSTLQATGDITTYGGGTFGNSATADQYVFVGTLQASSTALFGGQANFYDSIGVGTATPATTVGIVGTTTMTRGLVVGGATTGTPISAVMMGTCTYNPGAAIVASTTLSTNCTGATGVRNGDRVFVTPRSLANYLTLTSASSTATDDVVQVSVYNMGYGGPITPASATWSWMAIR